MSIQSDKDEIEKRMKAAVDLITFLDQRIAAQVEYQVELQVEKKLARERELWRGVVTDLIVKEVGDLVRTSHGEMIAWVQQMLDRVEAMLGEPMQHRSADDVPPSKH